jgi:membrane protease YdiL (CAAX protease family)
MSRFQHAWDYGDYRPSKVVLTCGLVVGSFILGNLPLTWLYPNDRGNSMSELVAYFGFTKLFLLQMIPFFMGLIGFVVSAAYVHKTPWLLWFTSRVNIDVKRILISFSIWAILIIIPVMVDWGLNPSKYSFNFDLNSFVLMCVLLIVCLPFQVLFEELLFRSFIFQGLMKRTKSAALAVLLSGVMFGFMHMGNPEVKTHGSILLVSYVTLGIVISLMAFLDQGIEVPFGFHLANNFVTAILVTSSDQAFQTPALLTMKSLDVSVSSFALLIASLLVFMGLASVRFGWHKIRVNRNNS